MCMVFAVLRRESRDMSVKRTLNMSRAAPLKTKNASKPLGGVSEKPVGSSEFVVGKISCRKTTIWLKERKSDFG